MAIVPDDRIGKVQFYENHAPVWAANAVALGTTTTATTDLTTKTTAARAAFNAQQAAKQVAEAATLTYNNAVAAMAQAGSDILLAIKTKASTTGDSIYTLAQIPAPATPTPVGPPGTPTDFKVQLFQDGSIELKWKCSNPSGSQGTMYQVYRRNDPTAAFVALGGTGLKSFTDATIPAGSSQVTYKIQAVRSTAFGAWAQFNVNFGADTGGAMTASIGPATAGRIAA